jgi:transposase
MSVVSVGLDFSKPWIDACSLVGDRQFERRFENTKKGWRACSTWLRSFSAGMINVAFEPTARYSERAVHYLSEQESLLLFQAHPKKFSDFKNSLDFRIKTDTVDAWALAVYAQERAQKAGKAGLQPYVPKTQTQKELRDIKLRLRSLYKRQSSLINQRGCGLYSKRIADDIDTELAGIEESIESVLQYARELVAADTQLSKDVELLDSIIGIGFKTALALVCVVDFRRFASADDLVCFLGLSNRRRRSGTSVWSKDRISKAGDKYIRSALYFPAQSAINDNPQLRAFAERLKARGKLHAVVRTAVARKLVVIAWSLIKNQKPYDPNYQSAA